MFGNKLFKIFILLRFSFQNDLRKASMLSDHYYNGYLHDRDCHIFYLQFPQRNLVPAYIRYPGTPFLKLPL